MIEVMVPHLRVLERLSAVCSCVAWAVSIWSPTSVRWRKMPFAYGLTTAARSRSVPKASWNRTLVQLHECRAISAFVRLTRRRDAG